MLKVVGKCSLFFLLVLLFRCYVNAADQREFESIKGPKSYHDKIAVVGAGPSGIHMAYLLKQKGFTNVEILEKSSRIGGKSRTLWHNGVPNEMGTCYIGVHYEKHFMDLVRKYLPNGTIEVIPGLPWVEGQPTGLLTLMNKMQPDFNFTKLLSSIQKYIRIHLELFGEYEFDLMPKPSKEVS